MSNLQGNIILSEERWRSRRGGGEERWRWRMGWGLATWHSSYPAFQPHLRKELHRLSSSYITTISISVFNQTKSQRWCSQMWNRQPASRLLLFAPRTILLNTSFRAPAFPGTSLLRSTKVYEPALPLIRCLSLTPSAFTQSLEHIQIAPELVFERLFGNVRAQHTVLAVCPIN